MDLALQIFQKWRDYYEGNSNKTFEETLKETEELIKNNNLC